MKATIFIFFGIIGIIFFVMGFYYIGKEKGINKQKSNQVKREFENPMYIHRFIMGNLKEEYVLTRNDRVLNIDGFKFVLQKEGKLTYIKDSMINYLIPLDDLSGLKDFKMTIKKIKQP